MSLAEGTSLVLLVRSAMSGYLNHRTPADKQPIPDELSDLAHRNYAVAVTLRDRGKVVGRIVQSGSSTPRNAIAAALRAMRDRRLPDRITAEVLEQLTVEVEVLGPLRDVLETQLRRAITPGLTGLRMIRGGTAYCLPSEAYQQGLDADEMRGYCVSQAPAESMSVEPRWSVFVSRHYVGYPRGKPMRLYRGKVLSPVEAIEDRDFPVGARKIAEFLVRRQDRSGCYQGAKPETPLAEHLYATYAMQRFAAGTDRSEFSSSVSGALQYAAKFLRREGKVAYVQAEQEGDNLAATSLMLAIAASAPGAPAGDLRQQLVGFLKTELGKIQDADARASGTRPAPRGQRGPYMACWALETALPKDSPDRKALGGFKTALARVSPADAEADQWRIRGGVPDLHSRAATRIARDLTVAAIEDSDVADEVGGFACLGQTPGTVLTGLVGVNLQAQLSSPGPAVKADALRRVETDLLGARRFCYRMTMKPWDAYWTVIPSDWEGAVRVSPASAIVTPGACAAALEALMSRERQRAGE